MNVTDWRPYAPYITEEEMRCKHTGRCEMRKSTMDRLLAVRLEYGRPMNFTSGFRDPSHPVEAAKLEPGVHTLGVAVDIAVAGGDALDLVHLARKHGFAGVGIQQKGASRFVHLDDYEGDPATPRPWIWSY